MFSSDFFIRFQIALWEKGNKKGVVGILGQGI